MIIDCISDLHGHYPKLEGGDLLIVAGDLTGRDTDKEHLDFIEWIHELEYRNKIYIAGNHDNFFCDPNRHGSLKLPKEWNIEFLNDSGIEFEGLRIWGTPWTKTFPGINPKCCAFTCDTEEELASKFSLIPNDIDILISHVPPYGILDKVFTKLNTGNKYVNGFHHSGSHALANKMEKTPRPRLHIFGHIHENGGKQVQYGTHTIMVNASHVNERYQPVNAPVRVIL